jgi:para-aminobenzoate synthetase/4-amino-4-deoxychorismate lyase
MLNQVVIYDSFSNQWLNFQHPVKIISTSDIKEVLAKLTHIESLVQDKGLFAVGFISYEAASAFDSALQTKSSNFFPLLWFGIYPEYETIQLPLNNLNKINLNLLNWSPSISKNQYTQAIEKIKNYIRFGDTYQVNFSFRLHSPFEIDSWLFFQEMIKAQQTEFGAYINLDQYIICSASPELFFKIDGTQLTMCPMKGTIHRGRTLSEDNNFAQQLQKSEKNRAENVMIVDMARNDMGKVAQTGSVQVLSLYDIKKYSTIWQMTSTVKAETNAKIAQIMAALFPCASITGAPKPNTMKIITELETLPRRIYTGCIGFIMPKRKAQFNVAIRTVLIDRDIKQAEYGVGGGIVWDSVTKDEYEECQIKAQVLVKKSPDFSLLETMLLTANGNYFLLDYHLKRIEDSAEYFDIPIDMNRIKEELNALAKFQSNIAKVIRLLVAQDGAISYEERIFSNEHNNIVRVRIAKLSVNSSNPFLYHKTTHRQIYNDALNASPETDDVILYNERNEITESCFANVVLELNGKYYTPPIECGLLGGTYRAWLLDQGKIEERLIKLEEIQNYETLYLINSVRKWKKALFV